MPRPRLSAPVVLLGAAALTAVLACGTDSGSSNDEAETPTERAGTVASALRSSAMKAKVPRDLLVAIAKVEEGLTVPAERHRLDVDNEVPAAGPLQLRRGKLDTLKRGAQLSGVTELELRTYADLALDAGALVLAELGAKTGATENDLASWSAAIAEMGGFADEPHREKYVHEVFATLARGGSFEARDGELVVLPPHDIPPSLTVDVSSKIRFLADAEYGPAEWIPTSCTQKCTEGRGNAKIEFVLVHDTEGSWTSSVATLQNDLDKSCHYIIDVDGRVAQFVTEGTTAWHAGNFSVNQRAVGIEHVGYSTKPYPEAQYVASAKLADYLTAKYSIPKDRAHIIGHDQVPNGNRIEATSPPCPDSPQECQSGDKYGGSSRHTDPGIWEWPTYMPRFGGTSKCNDVTDQWACSNDKTKAFRCENGKVDVALCEGTCDETTAATKCTLPLTAEPPSTTPTPDPAPTPATPGTSPPGTTESGGRRYTSSVAEASCSIGGVGRADPLSTSSSSAAHGVLVLGSLVLLRSRRPRRR